MADADVPPARGSQLPAPDPRPDAAPAGEHPDADAASQPSDRAPRTSDEYLEPPGSHRRDDGAATDVGA